MVTSKRPYGIETPFIVGAAAGGRITTGTTFFVQNTVGHDTNNHGLDPSHPLKTWAAATGKCTDSVGDVVYLMPGHAETLTGAGGLTLDKIGVTYIGLGGATTKPTILMDGSSITGLVTAADVTIENMIFNPGHADIAAFLLITAKGFTLRGCDVVEITGSENFKIAINVSAANNDADDLTIEGCRFIMPEAANTQAIKFNKDLLRPRIIGNYIAGDFAVALGPIHCVSTEVLTDAVVVGNLISNDASDTVFAINLAGTNVRGIVAENRSSDGDIDGTPYIAAGTCGLCENYHTGVSANASGYLYPGADN